MKKVIKSVALIAVIAIAVAFLAGCGNKLVATKTTDNEYMGKYDEKIEITFKNDKAQNVKWTYTFDNEENAKSLASMYSLMSEEGMEVKNNGKKVIITMSGEAFGLGTEGNTKEEVKEALEEQGYKVK